MNSLIARNLATARRARTSVAAEPAPAGLADSFDVSAEVAGALGETIAGWKVGHAPDGTSVAAPMYASGVIASGGSFAFKPGRALIPEVEIAVRLGRDLPPRPSRPYTRDELLDATAELLLGFELIERRIPKGAPYFLNLADDLGNIGYVVGPLVREFRGLDLARLRCQFWVDGVLTSDRPGGHQAGDPLVPMLDWANASLRDRLGGMKTGQIVTLGSLTPLVELTAPARLEAELEGFGRMTLEMT